MNSIELKPVGKVILNEHTPNREERFEHYLIPYYQRGYRWDVEHVNALLSDIHSFMLTDEKKYCLQPIVVVPGVDKDGYNQWEVIDGQQRLITMYIIFKYLKRPRYKILFEKRAKSTAFLEALAPETYNHDSPDFYYMSQAYQLVKDWFEENTKNDVSYIDDFNATLTKRVEIIWYQIEELKHLDDNDEIESKKIDVFNRLNIGKILLTDAELIRALLLSKIKHGLSDREAILRQAEISNEWHRIEMELRNEEFWYFVSSKPLSQNTSTIELIFRLIASEQDTRYSTYLWFEKEIKSDDPQEEKENALQLWDKTKAYFGKLKYWFNDNYLYHHLGFLLALDDKSLKTVKKIVSNSNCNKSAFKKWALKAVQEQVKDISLQDMSYENGTKGLHKVFLLHNVITTLISSSAEKHKFPFNLYKKMMQSGTWSIEHIHAQESKEIKEKKAIRKWLEDALEAIQDIKEVEKEDSDETEKLESTQNPQDFRQEIEELLQQEQIEETEFNQLKTKLIQYFDSDSVHVLDNLALLSSVHNSALNNAIFPVKRYKVLMLDKAGEYIPIATKNVFLKYYTDSDLQPYYWSKKDKANYYQDIKNQLAPYLTSNSDTDEQ